ncbi:MAG: non-canonical purine NTP diphosphatase [Dysgonamonadaceae bacterium]|jgi:XTP/dITP diphosphohydrolase|nr:non-canonical purine NTP diphosphatase [Dysgonamonadaceae bacterium]
MGKKLVFATNNRHKLTEVRSILGNTYQVLSLEDIGCREDIPETASTIEGNALIKARFVKQHYGYDCFADDTSLEVRYLDYAPGVYSARYAGETKDFAANTAKLLSELKDADDRYARFRTVIALISEGKEYLFEGKVDGEIIREKKGQAGFGYDPVFVPDGYNETFAELGDDIKNKISHRADAVRKLKHFLNENNH